MKYICDKDKCTGCAACMNRCPHQCISMRESKGLGHLYPIINQEKCVDCGACVKVCPVNNSIDLKKPLKAYAGIDVNEHEYKTSTSGGAASAFARFIIEEGGVVYGCAVRANMDICHVRIDNVNDLVKLKGSKYVQSSIGFCYKQVKEDIKSGRKVLFIGTPCQVAGVKSFIGKNDSLLYTVDLICHGVPSLAYLKRHILRVTGGRIPDEIYFRQDLYLLLLLQNNNVIYRSELRKNRYVDSYYNAFFDGFSYRNSCYACRYACKERVSDVTIGDFWGLKGELPVEHPYGCSVIMPLSAKGESLIEGIKPNFHLFDRPINEAVEGNSQLKAPMKQDWRVKSYRVIAPIMGMDFSYHLLVADKIIKRLIKKFLGKK